MEAFSLLKYWRGGGGAAVVSSAAAASARSSGNAAGTGGTPTTTTVLRSAAETDDSSGDDEGPFFDLEFTVPDDECEGDGNEDDERASSRGGEAGEDETDDEEEEEEREFNFTVSSEGSCGGPPTDPGLTLSPSDDLFFKGRLVPLEPSSLVFNPAEPSSKTHTLPVSLIKSATKLRVLMLGFKKPKSAVAAAAAVGDLVNGATPAAAPSPKHHHNQSKFFTVKFKVEEVPLVSLFTRDNSSRSSGSSSGKAPKQPVADGGGAASAEDKKFAKEMVQKYLNKIKPLYVRVSKRYGEKLRFSGHLSSGGAAVQKTTPPATAGPNDGETEDGQKEAETAPSAASSGSNSSKTGHTPTQTVKLPAGLQVVCKHLGKSRSASSAVAAVPSPPPPPRRRDDSLLQQQDGIQSAIAHCKRSFNASSDESDSPLPRSKSDPCDERSQQVDPKEKKDCV